MVVWLLFLPDPYYFSLIFATLSIYLTWESSSSFFRARLLLCSDSMDWFLKAMTSGTFGGVRGVYFLLSIFVQSSSLDVTLWTLFFLPSFLAILALFGLLVFFSYLECFGLYRTVVGIIWFESSMLMSSPIFEADMQRGVWDTLLWLMVLIFCASPRNFPGNTLLGVPPCDLSIFSLSMISSMVRLYRTRLFGIKLLVCFGHHAFENLLQTPLSLN